MSQENIQRIEKKFRLNEAQAKSMQKVFAQHMEIDQYGVAPIRNIYYDTDDYYLTRRSVEGPHFKEKLRVRSYQGFSPSSPVYVEIKRKLGEFGYKRRVALSYEQALKLLNGNEVSSDNPQIANEILQFVNMYHPQPKVYLSYERIAMFGKDDPNLRITIDKNLRYKMFSPNLDFDMNGTPILQDEAERLMEIKTIGSLPKWLVTALSDNGIYQSSFSKIGTCFTKHVASTLTPERN